ncbi:MAG: hypothetical protein GYA84_09535 [Firmicutes bacterium]|nr:hypothetical protein [Bacillota bacterium]
MRKRLLFILIVMIVFNMAGCNKAEKDDNEFTITNEEREVLKKSYEELDENERRKAELETTVEDIIKNRDYGDDVVIEDIAINRDMGRDEEGYYVALVRLKFERKNRRKTANEMMRMYSDDIVATLADKGVEDVSEAAVFWKDEYNNRNLKYAYEFKNGKFYITDVVGE